MYAEKASIKARICSLKCLATFQTLFQKHLSPFCSRKKHSIFLLLLVLIKLQIQEIHSQSKHKYFLRKIKNKNQDSVSELAHHTIHGWFQPERMGSQGSNQPPRHEHEHETILRVQLEELQRRWKVFKINRNNFQHCFISWIYH